MGNAALGGDARGRNCCGLDVGGDGGAPPGYARQGERPEKELLRGGELLSTDFDDEETQPGAAASPKSGKQAGGGAEDDAKAKAEADAKARAAAAAVAVPAVLGGAVFGSRAQAHRPSVLLRRHQEAEEQRSTPGRPDEDDGVDGGRRGGRGGAALRRSTSARMMRDGERGVFGPGVCRMLEQKHTKSVEEGVTRYVRVGTHRDGTCFFHSVLSSLNLDMKLALAPGQNRINDDSYGRPSERKRAYRNLDAAGREKAGADWRRHLARRVTEGWFRQNLHTDQPNKEAAVYCSARDRMIDFAQYQRDYADPEMYVGDSVWPHVAQQVGVNIFLLVASDHQGNPDAGGEQLPRIYTAGRYDTERKSVFLLLLDRGGSRGHYESLQTVDGVGCFRHFDPVTQLVLERQRLQNSPVTPQ